MEISDPAQAVLDHFAVAVAEGMHYEDLVDELSFMLTDLLYAAINLQRCEGWKGTDRAMANRFLIDILERFDDVEESLTLVERSITT